MQMVEELLILIAANKLFYHTEEWACTWWNRKYTMRNYQQEIFDD